MVRVISSKLTRYRVFSLHLGNRKKDPLKHTEEQLASTVAVKDAGVRAPRQLESSLTRATRAERCDNHVTVFVPLYHFRRHTTRIVHVLRLSQ